MRTNSVKKGGMESLENRGDDRLCLPCGAREGKKEVRGKKKIYKI
jgi:hypothetical protein